MTGVVDPIEEGFDVAFQMFPPLAETLIERKLFSVRRLFCMSPEYAAEFGMPQHPQELLQHKIALYQGYPSRNRWIFNNQGEQLELSLPGQIRSNSVHLLRDYAVSGVGIACLPTRVASDDLLAGKLIPVLTDFPLTSFNFSAVFPATQRRGLKVRSLIDFLSASIGEVPAWDEPLLERGWVN